RGGIEDVVVQKGGRMDELERDRRLDRVLTPRALTAGGGVEHQQDDEGTHAFAARADQAVRDLLQARLTRRELGREARLDAREVVLHRGGDGGECRGRGGAR